MDVPIVEVYWWTYIHQIFILVQQNIGNYPRMWSPKVSLTLLTWLPAISYTTMTSHTTWSHTSHDLMVHKPKTSSYTHTHHHQLRLPLIGELLEWFNDLTSMRAIIDIYWWITHPILKVIQWQGNVLSVILYWEMKEMLSQLSPNVIVYKGLIIHFIY